MNIFDELREAIATLLERLAKAIREGDREEAVRLWRFTPLRRLVERGLPMPKGKRYRPCRHPEPMRPNESLANYLARSGQADR
jgi:hypothetical protein